MTEPNEEIEIFKGPFKVKENGNIWLLEGEIFFSWFPTLSVRFSGTADNERDDPYCLSNFISSEYELHIDNAILSKGVLFTEVTHFNGNKMKVEGIIESIILGSQSSSVSKVRFAIPNLRSFTGQSVKCSSGDGTRTDNARISLEDNKYLIRIDKSLDFKDLDKKLQRKGGYMMLYSGELEAKQRKINPNDLEEITLRMAYFLSFLNARKTTLLFFQGIDEEETVWTDFTKHFYVDPYKYVTTWPPKYTRIEGLNEMWQKLNRLFDDENDKDFLTSAIWWYIEANVGSTLIESRIVTAQNCLELLYNWLVIEQQKLIVGSDSERISAANKIRLLISQLPIST